jgi:glycosyltransferase 2 family protein
MKHRGRIIGLVLTAVFVVMALQRVDLAAFADALQHFNFIWIVPSTLCVLLGYGLRTVRWRFLLSGQAQAPIQTLFPILTMGFATNNLLPGRLGEFWRAHMLGKKRNVRKTFALASVFVERVFDGLVLIGMMGLLSRVVPLPGWGQQIELMAAAVFLVATLVVALLVWQPVLAQRLLAVPLRFVPGRASGWIAGALAAFLEGLAVLKNPGVLVCAILLSIAIWTLEGASYLVLSHGVDLHLPPGTEVGAIGLALVTINFGIMVPSSPGYVGALEYFGTLALGVFGASAGAALALILVAHAIQYGLITGLGLIFFAREHISPSEIGQSRAMARGVPEPA